MQYYNVLSSHYDASFNSVLLNAFEESLKKNNHSFTTVDLYKDEFNPVMQGEDFNQFMNKPLPNDIIEIHEDLMTTDILTFFYPVWWCDMPAIMKGWIDRVFAKGFAYDYRDNVPSGKLGHIKKVILICTLGNKSDNPQAEIIQKAMRDKEEHGVFGYCGIKKIEHHFLYDVYQSEELRNTYIKLVEKLAE